MNSQKKLDRSKLEEYFIEHLDRIYSAKTDIIDKLPQIATHADFKDLRFATLETADDVRGQLERMDKIYALMDRRYTPQPHLASTGMIDDLFRAIFKRKDDLIMRDLSILFYLQTMESIEVASFKILKMVAGKLGNEEVCQLLKENFDEAVDDRALMTYINEKYLPN